MRILTPLFIRPYLSYIDSIQKVGIDLLNNNFENQISESPQFTIKTISQIIITNMNDTK